MFFTVLVSSYILRIFELPYFRIYGDGQKGLMDSYFDNIWCTCITMTTVGYGDIAPSTFPGKMVAICIAFSGSFLISMIVIVFNSIFYNLRIFPYEFYVYHSFNIILFSETIILKKTVGKLFNVHLGGSIARSGQGGIEPRDEQIFHAGKNTASH